MKSICLLICLLKYGHYFIKINKIRKERIGIFISWIKGPYQLFCMFEPNRFNFHTCNVTDNHFPKHTTGTLN
ncbi:hypothetical protein LDENG_00052740 [Lucifuga dentata]|nr:hypothetical protein LDENG_00052740 [Lucifuga dentata]